MRSKVGREAWLLLVLSSCSDPPESSEDGSSTTGESESGPNSTETETTGETGDEIPEDAVWIRVDLETKLADVDERFLSYTLDTDKVVSQGFEFDRARLLNLAAELSPAMLRIGGTKADRVYYDMSDTPLSQAPDPFTDVLNRTTWDAACDFAEALDLQMLFTVNAGPGPRDVEGLWTDVQARELIEYTVGRACPVAVWEFGNEPGAFGLEHGLQIDGVEYAADFALFESAVTELDSSARVAAPAVAYWPIEGEVPKKILPEFIANAGDVVDIVTWHYYPQQSTSCPIGSRVVNQPVPPLDWLETVEGWAAEVEGLRDANAPQAAVWLGETGHAQCGGEPGISNSFASSFWWLDQLGRIAARGQPIAMRQSLSGGSYNLVTDLELAPTPDYYASVLWKRHMGPTVLAATVEDGPSTLRAYAHCDVATAGVSILVINYAEDASETLAFLDGTVAFEAAIVTATQITATSVMLNGEPFEADADGHVPTPAIATELGAISLPPLSYAFVRLPDAAAAMCQ
jgi:heparanase 1